MGRQIGKQIKFTNLSFFLFIIKNLKYGLQKIL